MMPSNRRDLLTQILVLIAELDEEPAGTVLGARQAAVLVSQGRDAEAIATLRSSTSGPIAATGWLIESYLD